MVILIISLIVVAAAGFLGITGFIVVMATKKLRDDGTLDSLPWWVITVVRVWLVLGAISDIVVNMYATIPYRDWPQKGFLTSRLKRYRKEGGWRLKRAKRGWEWLNLYDPGHW